MGGGRAAGSKNHKNEGADKFGRKKVIDAEFKDIG